MFKRINFLEVQLCGFALIDFLFYCILNGMEIMAGRKYILGYNLHKFETL